MTDLKKVLTEQGRSQAWLAKKLGVSRQTINNWAQHRNNIPTQYLLILSELLGVSTDTLLGNGQKGGGNHE